MQVIILAAGQSKRFVDNGYLCPKPFLRIKYEGKTLRMIDWVLESLPSSLNENVLIGVPWGYKDSIERKGCIVQPIQFSSGQADTLYQLISGIDDQPILVLNCDVIFQSEDLENLGRRGIENVFLVQKSNSPAMSYINSFPRPTYFAEKQVISEYALSGGYFFATSEEVRKNLHKIVYNSQREPYISDVMNLLNPINLAIEVKHKPLDWGTPSAVTCSNAEIIS